jgi:hypothetical protein
MGGKAKPSHSAGWSPPEGSPERSPSVPEQAPRSDIASAARRAHLHNAAVRALDDPAKLERAARIVRVAIERGRLTPAQVLPEPEPEQPGA